SISKPVGEGDWAAGYKAQLWLGPDANLLGTSSIGATFQDFAIKQAYVELRAPLGTGLNIKLGVFNTPIGYESADGPDNANYTRSWGNTMEPTQHTGILLSYRFNDMLSISAGMANTVDPIINSRLATSAQSQKAYMASVTFTAPDGAGFMKGATLSGGVVDGRTIAVGGAPDVTDIYVGGTMPLPVDGLALGASFDHQNLNGATDRDAIAGYISYKINDKLKINARLDYYDDGAGVLFAPAGVEVITGTLTVDYALWENVISRLEWRWDHDASNHKAMASGGFARNNSQTIALNVVYKF
ncbi:MAG TPA: outer membrane beta-barrel protein, partial [Bryobacteraceae bacterium]|nr:outer membrane beta-barrel protein [Bryobacteraceae bacterium]